MLASDVLTDVVRDLTDPSHVRWTEAALLRMLSDGQEELAALRPDVLLQSDGTLAAVTAVTATTTVLLVGTRWRKALVDYVVYRALNEDDADTENLQRARERYAAFVRAMGVTA